MRIATVIGAGTAAGVAVVRGGFAMPVGDALPDLATMRAVAAGGPDAPRRLGAWADAQPRTAWVPLADIRLGPPVPDPGAIYTIGLNYRAGDDPDGSRPDRPLVYGKLPTAVAGHGDRLAWDRTLTPSVDPEVELGVVIGEATLGPVAPADALRHVFGWTCLNDVSSRDSWLDGDQWLLGKSMAGFCPLGPWIVTRDALDVTDIRLRAMINGEAIQDGRTSHMRFAVEEIIAFLSRRTVLRPGDLIATGTPPRLAGPPGPDRHLEPGDSVTIGIEGIGELTTHIT